MNKYAKYNASPKGLARKARYRASLKGAAEQMRHNHQRREARVRTHETAQV